MIFYPVFATVTRLMFKVFYKLEVTGLENIPKSGRTVICSNHVGNLDPVLLTAVIPRKLNYMGKKELFDNKFIGYWIKKLGAFPVDRDSTGLRAIKIAIKLLKEDKVFAIFPEGRRTQSEGDNVAKPGIAMISVKGKSSITPIHIDTQYELFKKIKINIGSPIHFDEYFDQKLTTEKYEDLSRVILKEIYKLK